MTALAYGVCAGASGKLERILLPSLLATAPEAPVLVRRDQSSIAQAYTSILAEAADLDVEGVVLLHDDVEVRRPLDAPLGAAWAEPDVGVVGAVGGRGFPRGAWWEGECFGHAPDPFLANSFVRGTHDVDAVDGLLIAVHRRSFASLRLSTRWYPGFHGYDVELCAQARAAGLRVRTTELDIFHHCKADYGNRWSFEAAQAAYQLRWHRDAPLRQRAQWSARLVQTRAGARVAAAMSPTSRTRRVLTRVRGAG